MSISDDGQFRTADTPLAAFLRYKQHELLSIELEDGRGFFVFEDTDRLRDDILEYQTAGFSSYYRHYRTLINMLNAEMKSRANGRGTNNNH